MTDESSPQFQQKESSAYVYFSSLYFVTVGALYLWGYWSPFGVNILEYLNLTDIVKSTAYPIASAFGFLALGVILSDLTGGKRTFPVGGGSNTSIGRTLRKNKPLLLMLYIAGSLAVLVFGPIEKWQMVLPILLGIPIALYASERNFLAHHIPEESTRSVCLFLLAILPFFAFGHGHLKAHAILEGKIFDYVLSPIDNAPVTLEAEPSQRIRFIGHAGDFLFFWEPKKSLLVISKLEKGKTLMLGHFEQKSSVPPQEAQPSTAKKL